MHNFVGDKNPMRVQFMQAESQWDAFHECNVMLMKKIQIGAIYCLRAESGGRKFTWAQFYVGESWIIVGVGWAQFHDINFILVNNSIWAQFMRSES